MDAATLKLVAQYGIGGVISLALVWLLGRILWKIGERMIAAIDEMRKQHAADAAAMRDALEESNERTREAFAAMASRFDQHTRADVEALKSVQIAVANLDGKFDAVLDKLDRTPVTGVPTIAEEEVAKPRRVPTSPTGNRIVDPIPGSTYNVTPKRGRNG